MTLTRRQEIERRKELERQREEENFTFSPKIITNPNSILIHSVVDNDTKLHRTSTFDKMYNDAMRRHGKRTDKTADLLKSASSKGLSSNKSEPGLVPECVAKQPTSEPGLVPECVAKQPTQGEVHQTRASIMRRSLSRDGPIRRSRSASSHRSVSRERKPKTFIEPTGLARHTTASRARLPEPDCQPVLVPQIRGTSKLLKHTNSSVRKSSPERGAKAVVEDLDEVPCLDDIAMKNSSGTITINQFERHYNLMKALEDAKLKAIKEKKEKMDEEALQQCTFQPKIPDGNPEDDHPAPNMDCKTVVTRSTKSSSSPNTSDFYKQKYDMTQKEHFQEMTFSPALDRRSEAIAVLRSASNDKNFADRLYAEGRNHEMEKDHMRGLILEELHNMACSFSPTLNPTTQRFACKSTERKDKPVYERLNSTPTVNSVMKDPSLDPKLSRSFENIHESTTQVQQLRDMLLDIKDEIELNECTFKPAFETHKSKLGPKHIQYNYTSKYKTSAE